MSENVFRLHPLMFRLIGLKSSIKINGKKERKEIKKEIRKIKKDLRVIEKINQNCR